MTNVTSSVYMRLVLKWNSSKAKSPVDPCTVTEQFDVNQQASAVGLYCFWFACDHANPPFTHVFFFLVCFCLIICFIGWSLSLSGIHCELAEWTSSAERDAQIYIFGLQAMILKTKSKSVPNEENHAIFLVWSDQPWTLKKPWGVRTALNVTFQNCPQLPSLKL